MKIALAALGGVVALAAVLAPARPAAAAGSWLWSAAQAVAPGVTHEQVVAPLADRELAVNSVRIAAGSASIAVETRMAGDNALGALEPLLQQAARLSRDGHRVVAAINGGTFGCISVELCTATGLNVVDGEVFGYRSTAAGEPPPTFAMTRHGLPLIGRPTLTASVILPSGVSVPITRVNGQRGESDTVLYTPRWGASTLANETGREIVLEGMTLPVGVRGEYHGTVTDIRAGIGNAPIAAGSLVISASAPTAGALGSVAVGDAVTIVTSIESGWQEVAYSLSGREVLVRGATIHVAPTGLDKSTTRHPRSAVGVTADGGLVMVTADGRQAHSVGATVGEMAQLMLQLGAVEAINLDGGGSTQLAVRRPGTVEAQIVNRPSSESRMLSNAIHVISTAPTGPLSGVAIVPGPQRLRADGTLQMRLGGHDAALNGVTADLGTVTWEASGGAATVDAAGVLTAVTPGTATVTARAGPWSASTSITVVDRVLEVGAPKVAFVAGSNPGVASIALRASWTIDPGNFAVRGVELQRRVSGGRWRAVALADPLATRHILTFEFGRRYELRVRARDASGFVTPWSTGERFRVEPFAPDADELSASTGWREIAVDEAIGGSVDRSGAPGEAIGYQARKQPFAIIGQRGPRHGVAQVWVGGELVATVGLHASTMRRRQVLYIGAIEQGPSPEWTTIQLRNASTGWRRLVDLDAILVIASLP